MEFVDGMSLYRGYFELINLIRTVPTFGDRWDVG